MPQSSDQFANISIYEPTNGMTSLTNASTLAARATIHVHGSSSAGIDKKAFSVGFQDDLGNDENYSPLGLPSESSWILYAPDNFEPVLIHNPLIYQLSNEIGRYAPRTKFCEVYLNTTGGKVTAANYNGIYVLEEKIKWDKNRVDITKIHSVDNLNPQDNAQPNVTGGYMMKIDRLDTGETGFSAAGQNPIVYNYPKETEIKTPQRAPQKQYLQNYMDSFGNALNGANYTDPTNGYRAFIDEPSWIDHHILNVVAFNVDALRLSAYFYKDRTNKLVFGPIWDFDRSQGSTDGRDFSPFYWQSPISDRGTDFFNYTWWGRMLTDIDFFQAWIDRYENLREGVLSTNHIYADIDALAAQVQHEQPREAARWPGLTSPRSGNVSVSGYSYNFPGTYQGEVNFLKKWYADRLHFMDTNFLAKPVLSGDGVIIPGFTLSMTGPSGATIYYTTNGSDPRVAGGGISADAKIYAAPVALNTNVTILARAYNPSHRNLTGANNPPLSSPWSGLANENFVEATAPVITQSPADVQAYPGQSPTLTVAATGNPTPAYQWQFNGTNLVGETSAQLALANLQSNQAGIYSVGVTNVAGGAGASFVLTIAPKPHLVITEVMSSEAKKANGMTFSTEDWWELSNFGNTAVNLQGWRFNDDHDSFASAVTITNAASIAPGEAIVFVNDMTPDDFRAWWGTQNLPANLQIIPYPAIGFGSDADAIYLWNAAAGT
ncbi:MAG: CotH kinase family protein, partial [Verrucomicrobiota bacterium]